MGVMERWPRGRGSSCGLVGYASEWWEWGVAPPSLVVLRSVYLCSGSMLRANEYLLACMLANRLAQRCAPGVRARIEKISTSSTLE